MFITFSVIEKRKKNEINLFLFNCNSFFQKITKNNIKFSTKHRITTARCFNVTVIFLSKNSDYFLTKKENNDIKTETNKTPITVGDLTRKSRF